jgi:hypothetical protein
MRHETQMASKVAGICQRLLMKLQCVVHSVAKTESPRGVSSGWSKIRGGFAIPKESEGARRRRGEGERESVCVCVCGCARVRNGVGKTEAAEAAEAVGRSRPERGRREQDK